MTISQDALDDLGHRLEAAVAKGRIRLLTPLPWRTRLRLLIKRAVNSAGIWLVEHGHHDAALWLWRDRRRAEK